MIKLCDCAVFPGGPANEYVWRDGHMDVRVGRIRDKAPQMLNGLNLEYLQPTYDRYNLGLDENNPNFPLRCYGYVLEHHLDGLMLDTPFENVPMPILGVQKCLQIKDSCRDKITMVNVGDAITFMGQGQPYGPAGALAVEKFEWILVETAADLRKPFDLGRWKTIVAYTEAQLGAGKTIVLGIYDEGGAHIDLALALMHGIEHQNLYWFYETDDMPPKDAHVMTFNWHPMLEVARLR